ncbi:MAG: NAD-dependent succinate-semialdehyde dehydrogenase [Betaproteobacteria bacterium]|nr:NAD-dependent succinate-semialdehyde dehydrogenase [Betaproteobacteria bacterium]
MLMSIKNQFLFREQGLIDGMWCGADANQILSVLNPASGDVLGTIPNMGTSETRRAIDAAKNAWRGWREKTARERGVILRRWYDLVLEHKNDLAIIMTLEQGRPLSDAKNEVTYAATFIDWYAEEGKRIYGDVIPSPQRDSRTIVLKESIGVCGAITPWNMPSAMVTRKVATALAAGCTVVLKPAEQTPYSAIALAVLAQQAGVPNGVFNLVTGDPEAIGMELTTNRIVRKITFTGSTEVGKILMRQSSDSIKKLSLELGGNSPFIVFDDADLKKAAQDAVSCKFRNSGQTCVCANRIYVQESVHDQFVQYFLEAVQALKVGNGFEDGVTQGPLIDQHAVHKMESHVKDALSHGAQLLIGGKRHALGANFYEPTILLNLTNKMRLYSEETFGPIAAIAKFRTEKEVIEMANDTDYGLAAYVHTTNIGRMFRVSELLEVGVVGINKGVFATEVAPFGGTKQSGIGTEGSKYGIEEYLHLKRLSIGGVDD